MRHGYVALSTKEYRLVAGSQKHSVEVTDSIATQGELSEESHNQA